MRINRCQYPGLPQRPRCRRSGRRLDQDRSQHANNGIANGLDYTKISNAGDDLPASAALGSGANDWACTRDNVTGLIWEVKTATGFRGIIHSYTWYNSASPAGDRGSANGGSCFPDGRCDTEKFVQDVNALGLCGHGDWRLPSRMELLSIVDYGRAYPTIDPVYFPNTSSKIFWSSSPDTGFANSAWYVSFYLGNVGTVSHDGAYPVRLVRGRTGNDGTCAFIAAGTVCRPSTGGCDVAEVCDGISSTCPTDILEPTGNVCRPATDDCDATEFCTGFGKDCPANGYAPNDTSCEDGDGDPSTHGVCQFGSCAANARAGMRSNLWD